MVSTTASLELRWGGLLGPIPRHPAGKQWPRNHRSEPRHRVSGSRIIVAVVSLGLPGILPLGVALFRRRQSGRNPEERGIG